MVKLFKSSHSRTVFLALLATVTFVGAAIWVFDAEPKLMLSIFIASVVCLLAVILCAFAFTLLRQLIKRWFEREP